MTFEIVFVLLSLLGMVAALVTDKMRPGMILFSVVVLFLCAGILTPKEMLEGFYSEEWYPGYINYVTSASSMTNFPKEKDPILAESDQAQPNMELVMYDGGGDDFQAIQNETAFDYKKLGAEMFTDGFDLDARLEELNGKWKAAREKLGIQ